MEKMVEKKAMELGNDMEAVKKEIKRLQSTKCRLQKQKDRSDYDQAMSKVLSEINLLQEVRRLLDPKEKPVTEYEQEDVDRLDYDQTQKAIRSIQSKLCLTRWLTEVEGDNDEFRSAKKIEIMLKAHRDIIKPVDEAYIRKSDLAAIIDTIESSGKLSQDRIIGMLKELL